MDNKQTNEFMEKAIVSTSVFCFIWGIFIFFFGINLMEYRFPLPLITLGIFSCYIGGVIYTHLNKGI